MLLVSSILLVLICVLLVGCSLIFCAFVFEFVVEACVCLVIILYISHNRDQCYVAAFYTACCLFVRLISLFLVGFLVHGFGVFIWRLLWLLALFAFFWPDAIFDDYAYIYGTCYCIFVWLLCVIIGFSGRCADLVVETSICYHFLYISDFTDATTMNVYVFHFIFVILLISLIPGLW